MNRKVKVIVLALTSVIVLVFSGCSKDKSTTPENDPPTADAGADQTVEVGTEVTLDGSGSSDPDGDALTYRWTQTNRPTVTLSDTRGVIPTFTPTEAGTCVFSLVVSDGKANSEVDEVTVTSMMPPSGTISIADGAAYTNQSKITLTLSATDSVSGVAEMMISNNSSFVGAEWEPYVTSKSWTLTGASGINTVYAKFKNYTGIVSIAVLDDIAFDNTPPAVTITSPLPGERVQGGGDVRIYFTVTDDTKIERVVSEGIIGPGVLREWEANALHYKRLEYFFILRPGSGNYKKDWQITIIAYDEVGNTGSAEVSFSVSW